MILPIHWNKSVVGKGLFGDGILGKERAGVSGGGDCVREVGG